MQTINFGFLSTALSVCFQFSNILGLFCTFFGPFGLSFWPFWANLWGGVRFKTFLEPTYVDNQLWFWKVSLIFSFLILSNLGPFLSFLGLSGLFFGLGSDSKNLLLPTYIDNQLWFWKYSHIFLFSIWPHLGPFLHFFGPFGAIFLALWGLLCGWGQVQKHFWNLPMQKINFGFGNTALSFCL